ncbi:MAG: response regulator [Parcubacteria group bacterium]|nr:response regulator [Parcubacteria group bacterium]
MKRILILEYDTALRAAIEHQLSMKGFDTVAVGDITEGVAHLESNPVDAIWLDHYLLGKENGIDFVAKVRSMSTVSKVPIFVVSNSASAENMRSYMQLGVDQYYTKTDYDLSQIIADIEYSLTS